jgi:hypothetical protein
MRANYMQGNKLYIYKIDTKLARDVIKATGPEQTVLKPYMAYGQVISKADLESMPSHGSEDLAIELLKSKQSSSGPIYNLSKKELDTLCS